MTRTFDPAEPIWCAGCGHYGVQSALVAALHGLGIPHHETMVLAGIGCSGTVQNNISAYGYHALHGRVLPAASGVVLANPGLTVIAVGGDGDGYAIGAGHLIHTFKRNPSFVYIVMNNGTYGLTKGQDSPTAEAVGDGSERGLDGVALGLSVPGSSFIARGFSSWPAQLERLMTAALQHARARRGFAFLEVLSPCVTYNDSYVDWTARVADADDVPGYDRRDRVAAFRLVNELASEDRIATGLLYEGDGAAWESAWHDGAHPPPAAQDVAAEALLDDYRRIMARYAV